MTTVVFQGEHAGAHSHIACRQAYPDVEPVQRPTSGDAIEAVALAAA